jgi:hypothetical protein
MVLFFVLENPLEFIADAAFLNLVFHSRVVKNVQLEENNRL